MPDCSEPRSSSAGARSAIACGPYRYVRRRWRLLFSLVDFLGQILFKLARRVAGSSTQRFDSLTPRSILLVQLDHLGDAVLTTGLLAAL